MFACPSFQAKWQDSTEQQGLVVAHATIVLQQTYKFSFNIIELDPMSKTVSECKIQNEGLGSVFNIASKGLWQVGNLSTKMDQQFRIHLNLENQAVICDLQTLSIMVKTKHKI